MLYPNRKVVQKCTISRSVVNAVGSAIRDMWHCTIIAASYVHKASDSILPEALFYAMACSYSPRSRSITRPSTALSVSELQRTGSPIYAALSSLSE